MDYNWDTDKKVSQFYDKKQKWKDLNELQKRKWV